LAAIRNALEELREVRERRRPLPQGPRRPARRDVQVGRERTESEFSDPNTNQGTIPSSGLDHPDRQVGQDALSTGDPAAPRRRL
jgi:hypothetical protein